MRAILQLCFYVSIVLVLNISLPVAVFAQDSGAMSQCRDIAKNYSTALSYEIEMNVSMFSGIADKEPSQTMTASTRKLKNLFYHDAFDRISVHTASDFDLLIDKSRKSIQIQKVREQDFDAPWATFTDEDMHYKLVSSENNISVIETGTVEKLGIDRIRITVNNETNLLIRVEYFYSDFEGVVFRRVQVDFTKTILNESISKSWFDLKSYVKKTHGKYSGVGDFSSYNVVELH
ncbi:MAG: hypothetical protein CVU11_06500 [Bacteroidetes bacterium HGW-Bacteroidetes-6]|nr:MAG: hypothetical protein CVU11_06500 [Bacteroidetes bacterium HGW-Bacteroidetes-6]